MNKNAKVFLIALAVIVLVVAAVLIFMPGKSNNPGTKSGSSESSSGNTPAAVTITYTDSGFASSVSTMKVGETVKVVNNSGAEIEFDSDPHPVHTDNTELNVGHIAPGDSKTFKIDKTGTWGYHNHLAPSKRGSIEVQ